MWKLPWWISHCRVRLQGWARAISHQTHEGLFCSLVLWDVLKEAIDASLGKLQTLKTANPAESKGIFFFFNSVFNTWLLNVAARGIKHDRRARSNRQNRLPSDVYICCVAVVVSKSWNVSSPFGLIWTQDCFLFQTAAKKRMVTSHSLSHVCKLVDACIDLYSILIFTIHTWTLPHN